MCDGNRAPASHCFEQCKRGCLADGREGKDVDCLQDGCHIVSNTPEMDTLANVEITRQLLHVGAQLTVPDQQEVGVVSLLTDNLKGA